MALLQAVLESPAVTDPAARAVAFKNDPLPAPLGQYVAKVHGESYRITDGEVEALLASGYSQAAVFELTVAAALGAAKQCLDAGLRAQGGALMMRLEILQYGHNPRNRLALRLMRTTAGAEPDDVIKTSLYRPDFFGRPWIRLLRKVMRGESDWSPGERELFAVFTSRLNTCRYCVGIHLRTTALHLNPSITMEQLDIPPPINK
jgi:hypothetical protein